MPFHSLGHGAPLKHTPYFFRSYRLSINDLVGDTFAEYIIWFFDEIANVNMTLSPAISWLPLMCLSRQLYKHDKQEENNQNSYSKNVSNTIQVKKNNIEYLEEQLEIYRNSPDCTIKEIVRKEKVIEKLKVQLELLIEAKGVKKFACTFCGQRFILNDDRISHEDYWCEDVPEYS
uniref:C2H2-type domain-containing protein n=1 Tax=Parastrongyloides trichosuri TaxID=131310 RepID=A0A0N4Z7Z0_PARTI